MKQQTVNAIADAFSRIPAVRAVVLGGSRATGTAGEASDVDIGIYYDHSLLCYGELNAAAQALDDLHRPGLICEEGGWGKWVNFGGWLTVDGLATDLIFRDIAQVQKAVAETDSGIVTAHYQTGHPHAFLNVMYRGELAVCRPFFVRDEDFSVLKSHAEEYPEAMRRKLLSLFRFEAGFSASFVRKYAASGDLSYLFGHAFRSVSAMNQTLFALNRTYCLNEKRAAVRASSLPAAPADYAERINRIFTLLGENPAEGADLLTQLAATVEALPV